MKAALDYIDLIAQNFVLMSITVLLVPATQYTLLNQTVLIT